MFMMTHLTHMIAVALSCVLALPPLSYADCCCKWAEGGQLACPSCNPDEAHESTRSCCSSLKKSKCDADDVDACHTSLSRRCECKRQFASPPLVRVLKRQTQRHSTTATHYLPQVEDDVVRYDSSVGTNQTLSRAAPGNVRLHVLDCRWLT